MYLPAIFSRSDLFSVLIYMDWSRECELACLETACLLMVLLYLDANAIATHA
jgi:hypothetical protein